MLYGDPIGIIHGLTIFKDFSNDSQFYYLPPEEPRIARVQTGPMAGKYALRLVIYRRDAQAGPSPDGVPDNGGFLDLDIDLAVDDDTIKKVKDELSSRSSGEVELAPVPFIDGTVSLTLLGRQSGDDTTVQTSMVRKVLGSAKPSLYGTQRASFSAIVDQDGALLMKQVLLSGGLTMALAQYDLTYQEIRPAYNLKITVNYESVYNSLREHFAAQVSAQSSSTDASASATQQARPGAAPGTPAPAPTAANAGTAANLPANTTANSSMRGLMAKAQFDKVMEDLKSNRSVVIEETDFGADPGVKTGLTSEQINEIVADLMGPKWFKPTLAPPALSNTVAMTPLAPTPALPQPTPVPTPPRAPTIAGPTPPVAPVVTPPPAVAPPQPVTPPVVAATPATGAGTPVAGAPPAATAPVAAIPPAVTPVATGASAATAATNTTTPIGPTGPTGPQPTTSTGSTSQTTLAASFEVDITSIEQTEKVTATYELNRREAATRQAHPAGQLVFDVLPEQASDYILEVSLSDDFFRRVQVSVTTNAEWDVDGISSIRVEFRYGPNPDATFANNDDVLINKTAPTAQWVVNTLHDQGNSDDQPYVFWYEYRVTVNYSPSVALGDESAEVTSAGALGADAHGWIRSFLRNLTVNPRDVTLVHPVRISTGVLQFDVIQEVQMLVSAGQFSQTYRLTPVAHDLSVVVRPEPGKPATFKTSGTVFFKDDPGARIELPEAEWNPEEQLICVNEPDFQVLRVRVYCSNPGGLYTRVSTTLRYRDGDREITKTFDFTDDGAFSEFSVRLSDPDKIGYSYNLTTVATGGAVQTTDWTDSSGAILVVGYTAVDVIPIIVQSLQTFPAGKLLAVQVFLKYDDPDNDVHWEKSEAFLAGKPPSFNWSIALKDRKKRNYQYRIMAFKQPPATNEEIPWTTTSETLLIVPPFAG